MTDILAQSRKKARDREKYLVDAQFIQVTNYHTKKNSEIPSIWKVLHVQISSRMHQEMLQFKPSSKWKFH